jgi:hypothetical protein
MSEISIHDVQVSAAHAASRYLDQDLPGPRFGYRQLRVAQRRTGSFEQHGMHALVSLTYW